MAAAGNNDVELLIRTTGDPTGAVQISGALKDVQAQGVAAAAAITGSWERLSAVTGQTVAQLKEVAVANQTAVGSTVSGGAISGASAQELAIQREISAIVQTRRALLEAQIVGQTEQVAALRTELGIRQQTLAALRSEDLSQAGLNNLIADQNALLALAATRNTEVAATGLVVGGNLAKARQEAIVLGREIAVGNVRASTLGSLMGSLGNTITIAAIAGYELYRWIDEASKSSEELEKFQLKLATDVHNAVADWIKIAKTAQDIRDQIKLSDKIDQELAKISSEMANFRAKELGNFEKFADMVASRFGQSWTQTLLRLVAIAPTFGASLLVGGGGPTPYKTELDDQKKRAQEEYNRLLTAAGQETLQAVQATKEWAAAEANLPVGIATYTQKVADAQTKVDSLISRLRSNPADAGIQQALNKALHELDDAKDKLNQLGDEQDALNRKSKQGTEQRKEFSALLRDEATMLQRIRQENQLIQQNPFLSADAKQSLLAANMRQELAAINIEIQRQKTVIQHTALDPTQLAAANQKMQEMVFRAQQLKLQLAATGSFGGQLKSELASWANSFGDTAHQIGQAIQGSINTNLQQLNQLLLTGKFNVQSLLQSMAQIGLTLVEQIAIQKIAAILGITEVTGAQVASGAAITTAHAPAAAATSISSYGAAAVGGEALALAAISAITGALGVAHEGGVVGRLPSWGGGPLAHDERLVVTKVGETILPTHRGPSLAIPKFHSGGVVDIAATFSRSVIAGSPAASLPSSQRLIDPKDLQIEVYHFTDMNALNKRWAQSTAGRKILKEIR